MTGLPDGQKSFKIGLAVLIQYRHVTDRHPASQQRSQPNVSRIHIVIISKYLNYKENN